MKRSIILAALFFVASSTIISCKKSSSNNSIVGSWVLSSGIVVNTDSTTTPYTVTTQDTTIVNSTDVVQFNADNTYAEYNLGTTPPSLAVSGTYVLLRGVITLFESGGGTPFSALYSVSGNTLTIIQTENNPGTSSTKITEKFIRE
ncbi:MAG TPA: lipocalin family protein [Ferruginibacter sp.]|nr:lipocalin family protein [Ferruginibacter sp.]